jgi:hypothetical protein
MSPPSQPRECVRETCTGKPPVTDGAAQLWRSRRLRAPQERRPRSTSSFGGARRMITTCASVPKPTSAMSACETAAANAWAVAWSECCSARPNRGLAMGAAPVHGLPSPTPSRSRVQHVAPGAGVQSAPANGQPVERGPFRQPSSVSAFGSIALGRTFDRIDRAAMCPSPVRHLLRRCLCPKAQAVRQPAHR